MTVRRRTRPGADGRHGRTARCRRDGLTVGLLGELGCGNLGNDGSFAVVLDELRREFPDARPVAFAYGVEHVSARYGVEARRMNAGALVGPGRGRVLKKLACKVLDPLRTWWQLRDVDVVVVPGAGVLEGHMGTRPLGLPYALWRTAWAARIRGIPLALVGVGVSPTENALSRYFFASVVRAASMRTFRDEYSREIARVWSPRAAQDPVVPDIAYGFDVPSAVGDTPVDQRCVVVGVMAYRGPLSSRDREEAVIAQYLEQVSAFVRRLIDEGWRVRLIGGDYADHGAIDSVASAVGKDRVERVDVEDFGDLAQAIGPASFVVATRFHNVLMSLRLGKPTVAAGYGIKNREMLQSYGLADFYVDPGEITADVLWDRFQDLVSTGHRPPPDLVQQQLVDAESHWGMIRDFLKEIQ